MQPLLHFEKMFEPLHTLKDLKSAVKDVRSPAVGVRNQHHTRTSGTKGMLLVLFLLTSEGFIGSPLVADVHGRYVFLC